MSQVLEAEHKIFETNLKGWESAHAGKFVLIKNNEVIGFYSTIEEAFAKGTELFGLGLFFINQILPSKSVNVIFLGKPAKAHVKK